MRALAPEVRLLGHAGRNRSTPQIEVSEVLGHKEILQKSLENRTSGAEALSDRILYGTAEAVPFVQSSFPRSCLPRSSGFPVTPSLKFMAV
jgi:hypothetical protein